MQIKHFKQINASGRAMAKRFCALFLLVGLISCLLVSESLAGKGNKGGGDDIILYNGNIVLRGNGGGGKGKGKGGGGGSIVVANSPQHHNMDYMPMWGSGGFRRRR